MASRVASFGESERGGLRKVILKEILFYFCPINFLTWFQKHPEMKIVLCKIVQEHKLKCARTELIYPVTKYSSRDSSRAVMLLELC